MILGDSVGPCAPCCVPSIAVPTDLGADFAGAHFHIPFEWLTASLINETTYQNMLFILSNELDWPELSATSGYKNSTWWQVPRAAQV
jgi:acyloxyacyl hydrolase